MTDKGIVLQAARSRNLKLPRVSLWEWIKSQPSLQTWAGVCVIALVILALKLPIVMTYAAPSGADPGNWLSLAWSLTGQGSRLTPWAYPPLTFIILRFLLGIFPPLVSLKILGLGLWVAMTGALWLVLKKSLTRIPAIISLAFALFVGLASYNNEVFAWGGYPQMLGLTFLILVIPNLEAWLINGNPRNGWIAVFTGAGVVYSHHLIAALLPVMAVLVVAWATIQERWQRRMVLYRAVLFAAGFGLFSIPALWIYINYLHLLAGNPTNANGFSFTTIPLMMTYVFRDLELLWLSLLALSLVAPFLVKRASISGSALAFTWGPVIACVALLEVRFLQVVFVGIAMAVGVLVNRAWQHPASFWIGKARQGALLIALSGILIITTIQGQQVFAGTSNYYRVITNDIIPGMDWLKSHTSTQDIIAVSRTQPDLLGWWVEGYAHRPAIYAADLRWLTFSQERQNATIANEIFDPQTNQSNITSLIAKNHISYLFIDKKFAKDNFQRLLDRGFMSVSYSDNRITILKITQ